MLRLRLRGARIRAEWVNIWEDQAAAARVRAITGGDETVPTVVVGARAMVNPPARQVIAAVRAGQPGVVPAARARPASRLARAAGRLTRRRAGTSADGPGGHTAMKGQAPLRGMSRARMNGPAGGSGDGEIMQVDMSSEAAGLVRDRGGVLWVWAARPRVCCWGTPAYMHAATERPPGLSGFSLVSQAAVEIWFRAPAGRVPDVLEIGLRGRRQPRVEAYWDGCRIAL